MNNPAAKYFTIPSSMRAENIGSYKLLIIRHSKGIAMITC
jgi:hypothetical protein